MVDKDILFAKTNNIQNCLARIKMITESRTAAHLDEMTRQDVVVLNLQRAVQAVIDIAAHITASERLGIPQTQKELFLLLQREHIIPPSLAQSMQRMVGFRNIAVHDYGMIDSLILESILKNHLSELEEFYTQVLEHYHLV